MLTKFIRNPEDMLNVSEENVERIREQSTRIPMSSINDSILDLARTLSEAKWSTQPRILLELCILRLASGGNFGNLSADSVLQDKNMIAVKKTEEKKEEFEAAERQPAMTDTVPDVVQVSDIDMDAEQVAGTDVDVGQVPDAGIDAGQVADTGIDVEKSGTRSLKKGSPRRRHLMF